MAWNEEGYLAANLDVAAAVKSGVFSTGWDHYQATKATENRTLAPDSFGAVKYANFDNDAYLAANADVAQAILKGGLLNAWQHFVSYGSAEGRTLVPAGYGTFNEDAYLAANADVAKAVDAGVFSSGWAHYQATKATENRTLVLDTYVDIKTGATFNEYNYLCSNSDVAKAVKAGTFESGWQHYELFGQKEGRTVLDAIATFGDAPATPAVQTFTLTATPVDPAVTQKSHTETYWGYNPAGNADDHGSPANGGIPVADLADFLVKITGLDFKELGLIDANGVASVAGVTNITIGNVTSADSSKLTITYADGTIVNAEAALGAQYTTFLSNLLFDANGNSRLYEKTIVDIPGSGPGTVHPIVLTTTQNNGGTMEAGRTNSGNDTIVAGSSVLLNGAYIDGGAGYNILEVDATGGTTLPKELLKIQEIRVQNDGTNSVLDLSHATSIEKLVVTEGWDATGIMSVAGIRNNATARLEGNFEHDVNLHYGQGLTGTLNLELALGDVNANINLLNNASVLKIDSQGVENHMHQFFAGGTISQMVVTGEAAFAVDENLTSSFNASRPAIIDASANTGGLDVTLNGHANLTVKGTQAADVITATGSTKVTITAGNGDNSIHTDDSATVNITAGTGNDTITSTSNVAGATVTIDAGAGNNTIHTDGSATVNITAGAGNDIISSVGSVSVVINAGNGNNTIVTSGENINITTGTGNDKITVAGMDDDFAIQGALLTIDTGAGQNTIVLGDDSLNGVTAMVGSTITGSNIKLFVETASDLTKASLTGVTSVVMEDGLTLTAAQFKALGAIFVADESLTHVADLTIVVGEGQSFDLGSVANLASLSSSVKLHFELGDGANLTLTALQLHNYLADNAVHGINGTVTLNNAGLTFAVNDDGDLDHVYGTILTTGPDHVDALIINRDVAGFNRPAELVDSDTLTINSDVTPVISSAITSDLTSLKIIGSHDLNFTAAVALGSKTSATDDFTINFSKLTGTLTGLTVKGFDDVKEVIGNDIKDAVTGLYNHATRINVELNGNVADGAVKGLKSSGVAEYVVTSIADINTDGSANDTATFNLSAATKDLQVLGLHGNAGNTVHFAGVPFGSVHPSFLLEGDGYASFDGGLMTDGTPDQSNIGTLKADFFTSGAPAVVNINNHGVALGLTTTGEARPLVVDGIDLINAVSLTINVADGNAEVKSIDGNQQLKDVTLVSAFDVTLHLDAAESSLHTINASGVAGVAALVIDGNVDLSATTLTSIEHVVLTDTADITLTLAQIDAIGVAHITVEHTGDTGILNVSGIGEASFVAPELAHGIHLGTITIADLPVVHLAATTDLTGAASIIVHEGTVLYLTAHQFQELDGAGSIIGGGTVNITDLTTADVNYNTDITAPGYVAGDVAGLDLSGITAVQGTITLGADVVLNENTVLSVADPLHHTPEFGIHLAQDQTITLAADVQANERVITAATGTNTTVILAFDGVTTEVVFTGDVTPHLGINTSGFSGITTVEVPTYLIDNIANVERVLANLDQSIVVDIVQPEEIISFVSHTHRVVVVEPGAEVSGSLLFEDFNNNVEVTHIDLTLKGAVDVHGNINVPASHLIDDLGFQELTIHSTGDTANTIEGNLLGGVGSHNNFLNVVIDASQELTVGGIVFTADAVTTSDHETATLKVGGAGDVAIDKIVTNADANVDNLEVTHTGAGSLTLGLDGSNVDATDHLTIAGSTTGNDTLIISNTLDLSADTLSSVETVVLTNNAGLTLTQAEIDAIQLADITVAHFAAGDKAVLNVVDLGAASFNANGALLQEGVALGTITIVGNAAVTLDPTTNLTGAVKIVVQEGTTLTMTAAQFQQLAGAGSIEGAIDPLTHLATTDFTVNITDLTQADVDYNTDITAPGYVADDAAGLDLSGIVAGHGNITLKAGTGNVILAANTSGLGDNASNLGTLDVALVAGDHLTLSDADLQANGRTITGPAAAELSLALDYGQVDTEVVFTSGPQTALETGNYSGAFKLEVLTTLVEGHNVEQLLAHLSSTIIVDIVAPVEMPGAPAIPAGTTDRVVVVEAGVTIGTDGGDPLTSLIFANLDNTTLVKTLDITLEGGATVSGLIDISTLAPLDGVTTEYFNKLTITSEGTLANTLGDIRAGVDGDPNENNLLNVAIHATEKLAVGTITFTALDADSAAHLTVNGTADVTIAALHATDAEISALTIANDGTGVLSVIGASPALELNIETLTLSGTGNMAFGTYDNAATIADEAHAGINSNTLSQLDAHLLTGALDLGVITNVDSTDFTFTAGSGVTHLTLGAVPHDGLFVGPELNADSTLLVPDRGWSFDLTGAAAGSNLTITNAVHLDAGVLDVELGVNGTLVLQGDVAFAAGIDNVNIHGAAGVGGIIDINGVVDFTTLVHTDTHGTVDTADDTVVNELSLTGIDSIVLGDRGAVRMTDVQYADFLADGGHITGDSVLNIDSLFVTDHGIFGGNLDITDFRGVTGTEVDVLTAGTGLHLTAEQALATHQVDVALDGTTTRAQWDDNGDSLTATVPTPLVDRADGDFRDLAVGTVSVIVSHDADLTTLKGVGVIDVTAGSAATLHLTGAQADALVAGSSNAIDDMAGLSDLIFQSEYVTVDPDLPPVTLLNIDVAITHAANGTWLSHTVTGAAGAIGIALHDSIGNGFQSILDSASTITQTNLGGLIASQEGTFGTYGVKDIFQFVDPNLVTSLSATTIKSTTPADVAFDANHDIGGATPNIIDDVLDFSKALTTVGFKGLQTGNNATAYSMGANISGAATDITDAVYFVNSASVSGSLVTAADIAYMFTMAELVMDASSNAVIFEANGVAGNANVWYITNDGTAAIQDSEVHLVGVITDGSSIALTHVNFGI